MAQDRTAEYLVDFTLDLIQLKADVADSPIRRGFPDDDNRGLRTSVLRAINDAIRRFVWTGYHRCYVDLTLSAADGDNRNMEYGLPSEMLRVVNTTMVDPDYVQTVYHPRPLTLAELDNEFPGWRYSNAGIPERIAIVSDIAWVHPAPSRPFVVSFLADTSPDDLVNKVDIPARMPNYFHEDISYAAAELLSYLGALNPSAEGRVPFFREQRKRAFNELREVSNNKDQTMQETVIFGDPYREDWR